MSLLCEDLKNNIKGFSTECGLWVVGHPCNGTTLQGEAVCCPTPSDLVVARQLFRLFFKLLVNTWEIWLIIVAIHCVLMIKSLRN